MQSRPVSIAVRYTYLNLEGGFDSARNRQCIFNAGLIPNIPENPRNRKRPKRGRKRLFNAAIHALRMRVRQEPGRNTAALVCCLETPPCSPYLSPVPSAEVYTLFESYDEPSLDMCFHLHTRSSFSWVSCPALCGTAGQPMLQGSSCQHKCFPLSTDR